MDGLRIGQVAEQARVTWKQNLLMLAGIGVALLPKLACPLCWPAYASIVTSIGLAFLLSAAYLFPITAAFLLIVIATLAFGAKQRRSVGPMLLAVVASVAILAGKFAINSTALVHGGAALLLIACVRNAWPLGTSGSIASGRCALWTSTGSKRKQEVKMDRQKRKVEVFSAGCLCCDAAVDLVRKIACPSCEVRVHDMKRPEVAARAQQLGIRSIPAVVVDGKLADCCSGRGPDADTLRAAGVGVPL